MHRSFVVATIVGLALHLAEAKAETKRFKVWGDTFSFAGLELTIEDYYEYDSNENWRNGYDGTYVHTAKASYNGSRLVEKRSTHKIDFKGKDCMVVTSPTNYNFGLAKCSGRIKVAIKRHEPFDLEGFDVKVKVKVAGKTVVDKRRSSDGWPPKCLQEEAVVPTGETVSLENRARAGLVLDIDGRAWGMMPLQEYKGSGCEWILEPLANGYYRIRNQAASEEGEDRDQDDFPTCLDVDGRNFGQVILAKYSSSGGCDWKPVAHGNGHIKLVNRYWTDKKGEEIVLDIDGKTNLPIVGPYFKSGGCDWKVEVR